MKRLLNDAPWMVQPSVEVPGVPAQSWERFDAAMRHSGAHGEELPGMRRRFASYLRDQGIHLSRHGPAQVEEHVGLLRFRGREEWQIRHTVRVLRMVFRHLSPRDWARDYHWAGLVAGLDREVEDIDGEDGVLAFPAFRHYLRERGVPLREENQACMWVRHYTAFHDADAQDLDPLVAIPPFLDHLEADDDLEPGDRVRAAEALLAFAHALGHEGLTIEALGPGQRLFATCWALDRHKIQDLWRHLDPLSSLVAQVVYVGGLPLSRVLCLRLRDLPRQAHEIRDLLRARAQFVAARWQRDLGAGLDQAAVDSRDRRRWGERIRRSAWCLLFSAERIAVDPRTGQRVRPALGAPAIERALKEAGRRLRLPGVLTSQVLVDCHRLHGLLRRYPAPEARRRFLHR